MKSKNRDQKSCLSARSDMGWERKNMKIMRNRENEIKSKWERRELESVYVWEREKERERKGVRKRERARECVWKRERDRES